MFEQPINGKVYKCQKCNKYYKETGLYTIWNVKTRTVKEVRICETCFNNEKEDIFENE